MRNLRALAAGVAASCLVLGGFPSTATADNQILGVFKDWIAQRYTQNQQTVCMMWSQPEKAEGDYKQRGDIFVFLSHRPGESRRNEIRFEAGYDFQGASLVKVTIDDQHFTLATDASTAWLTSSAEEEAMVRAMMAGREMLVEGTSSRGTDTKDTYSLYGFTAAHKAIGKECS